MKLRFILLILFLGVAGCQLSKHSTITSAEANVETSRHNTYHTIATQLALLSDQALAKLIEQKTLADSSGGSGGTVGSIEIDGIRVFFKKINLTDLERQSQNVMSTKNMFDVPWYYRGAGFGVWRELFVHIMTTNWVLTGACPNFPLMYHWRVLPKHEKPLTTEDLKHLEEDVTYWGGSSAIRTRLEAIKRASASIVLFLEQIPHVLDKWFEEKLTEGDVAAKEAVAMVEKDLKHVISFMQSNGLLHFDAHFWNILTDGHHLYFTDFGLAISSQFELSEAEINFFKVHRNYDRYEAMTKLVRSIISSLCGRELLESILHEYSVGKGNSIKTSWASAIVARYAPMAVVMDDFSQKRRKNKTTPYPVNELEQADKDGMEFEKTFKSSEKEKSGIAL